MRTLRALALALGLLAWQTPALAQQIVSGGGGGGGISSVTAGNGLAATAGTCNSGSGSTLSACNDVLTKTGNYTLVNGDGFKTLNCNNAGGCVFTIPQATASGNFAEGWSVCFTSQLGTVTLTPVTSTIYALGSQTLLAGQTACVQSDGTNYLGTGGATTGPQTVTGILTTSSGRVQAIRVVTAAGAVTAATTDDHICLNKASGAATTVNLFATPTTGTVLEVEDCKGDANTNNITVTPNAGNIDGSATFVINTAWGVWVGIYNGTIWKTVSSR